MTVHGKLLTTCKVLDMQWQQEFWVIEELAEPCILGQAFLTSQTFFYEPKERILHLDERGNIVPTYVRGHEVVSVGRTFQPMVPVRKWGRVEPNTVKSVEIDISGLPVGGTYLLKPSPNFLSHRSLWLTHGIVRRTRVDDLSTKVLVYNMGKFPARYTTRRALFEAELICPTHMESKYVFDPRAERTKKLTRLWYQLMQPEVSEQHEVELATKVDDLMRSGPPMQPAENSGLQDGVLTINRLAVPETPVKELGNQIILDTQIVVSDSVNDMNVRTDRLKPSSDKLPPRSVYQCYAPSDDIWSIDPTETTGVEELIGDRSRTGTAQTKPEGP